MLEFKIRLAKNNLFYHIKDISDPRKNINIKHRLIDIIFISICAVLCGCEYWEEIESFGKSKLEWFKKYLKLENDIPSHDRFRAVLINLDSQELERSFGNWVDAVIKSKTEVKDKIINIDGKTLRRSGDEKKGIKPLHMVSAWSNEYNLSLGQVKTEEKSNEIKAIPELVKALNLDESIVTIDAMGCQKDIVEKITKKNGKYVIGLKDNQKNLHSKSKKHFKENLQKAYSYVEEEKLSHGRQEKRSYYLLEIPGNFNEKYTWKSLESIGMVRSEVLKKGVLKESTRYFVSSLNEKEIKLFAKAARGHWGIENKLHWQLDVSFSEDQCRKRMGNSGQNFSILRKMTLNMLKQDKSKKVGIASKRRCAGYDEDYFHHIMTT